LAEVAILVLANETHADIGISLQDAVREVGDSSVYVVGADLKNRMTLAVGRVARNVLEIDQSSKAGTVREAVEHFGLLD
jgi:hypothetical protein